MSHTDLSQTKSLKAIINHLEETKDTEWLNAIKDHNDLRRGLQDRGITYKDTQFWKLSEHWKETYWDFTGKTSQELYESIQQFPEIIEAGKTYGTWAGVEDTIISFYNYKITLTQMNYLKRKLWIPINKR